MLFQVFKQQSIYMFASCCTQVEKTLNHVASSNSLYFKILESSSREILFIFNYLLMLIQESNCQLLINNHRYVNRLFISPIGKLWPRSSDPIGLQKKGTKTANGIVINIGIWQLLITNAFGAKLHSSRLKPALHFWISDFLITQKPLFGKLNLIITNIFFARFKLDPNISNTKVGVNVCKSWVCWLFAIIILITTLRL